MSNDSPETPEPVGSTDLLGDWKRLKYSGAVLRLAPGMELNVSKSLLPGEGYRWSGLGVRGKTDYDSEADAKVAATKQARRLLERALASLPNA